jgi:hypothetical protein
MLFMLPQDQARLRECMTYRSLLDELLAVADRHSNEAWFQQNARSFLEVCELFAQTANQHHDMLVKRFIEKPAEKSRRDRPARHYRERAATAGAAAVARDAARSARRHATRSDLATRCDDLAKLRGLTRREDCSARDR